MTLEHVSDPQAAAVLRRLHQSAEQAKSGMVSQHWPRMSAWFSGLGTSHAERPEASVQAGASLDPQQAAFLYSLVCGSKARTIVEYGTALGVATIWLALAARSNWGRVITTELDPQRALAAGANIDEAGLSDVVDIWLGDASQTLRSLDEPVDFVFSDGAPEKALEVLQLLRPVLIPGAVIVSKYTAFGSKEDRAYTDWLRHPANGFVSTTVPFQSSMEVSVFRGEPAH